MIYPIFTATQGKISGGAAVEVFTSDSSDFSIPAILIGETGRGRELGILPVDRILLSQAEAGITIKAASIGETPAGTPKLYAAEVANTTDKAIVVFRTDIGFRGGNAHAGDGPNVWKCKAWTGTYYSEEEGGGLVYCGETGIEKPPKHCPKCNIYLGGGNNYDVTLPELPGDVLVKGVIAQGAAGYMGSGKQLIAMIPKGVVFCTHYYGRLYGKPSAHYMEFTGEKIVSVTSKERGLAGLPSDTGR